MTTDSTDAYNVVLVVLDTVRARQLGLYGRELDPMSNLSAFAENATVFDRAYTNAPWTVPAHASLFTGQLPSEHGCHGGSFGLSSEITTLAERFSSNGYRTIGLSNNVWISDHFGFDAGFDEFYKEWQFFRQSREIGHVIKEGTESIPELARTVMQGNPAVNLINGVYGKYLYRRNDFGAKRTTDDARSLLTEVREPFFLFINYMEGHAPFLEHDCTERFLGQEIDDLSRYTELSGSSFDYHTGELSIMDSEFEVIESLYDGELCYLDSQLDRLFDALDDDGLLSESIVVVVGDHGENIGDHGLLAHRFSVHDTLLHVPLIVHHPEWGQGERIEAPVGLTDLSRWLFEGSESWGAPETLPSDGPVVAEYLSTDYTPEAQNEGFEFEESEFNRRQAAAITDEHKLTVTDRDERTLYEYGDGSDFEVDGTRISAPEVEARLLEHCPSFDQEFDDSVDERNAVEQHLKDLGYVK